MTANSRLIRENVPLAPLTYYKIGGPARFFAQPEKIEDLAQISAFLKDSQQPYFVLGAGSNVLIDDRGFDGLIIQTSKLERSLGQNGDQLQAGASVMVIHVLRHCMAAGLEGFEFLVGIPGSMGGVLCMNAGTHRGAVANAVVKLTAYDLDSCQSREISGTELVYSYRKQHFLRPHEIILNGTLQGRPSDPKKVQNEVQALLEQRKKSQPIDKPSCGSVFKNPEPSTGLSAWKAIDLVGLRGHREGQAQISELHSNFIVNLGGAKASDVLALIDLAKRHARDRLGIDLEEEVRIVPYQGGKRI